tara:strand:- start:78 stop:464 length:387 start_codon:yes stop_codon:yes gene_type:complete
MSRKIFMKLRFDIEKFPKEKYYKGKKGTYGELDIVLSVDAPYVKQFDDGNVKRNFASVSMPQSKDEREAGKDKHYLDNWDINITSVGEMRGKEYVKDQKWYDTVEAIVNEATGETVEVVEDPKGDLPF